MLRLHICVKVKGPDRGVDHMRIGELAERTGTSRRLLRYYEEQGLIVSTRLPNGYRDFDEICVERVRQIRGLLDAGLPTRVIRRILPCLITGTFEIAGAPPETVAMLERERDRITERIRSLVAGRDAISRYLAAARDPRANCADVPVGRP
jgi:Predicted transcriptional regulators